jgi:DME family drug/metabolite transporter
VPANGRGYLLVLGAAAAWSTSGLFIRWTVAGSGLSALSLAFWRDLATFACLLVGLGLVRPRLLRVARRDLLWLAALGAIGVGTFHVVWNLAILHIGYAIATVLLYFSPAFVTLMAWLIWGEPLTRFKVLAIALALTGCVLVAGREELAGVELTAGGLILGLVAAMAYGSFSLFGRQVAGRYSPWTVLTYSFGFGALALFPFQFGAASPVPVSPAAWTWFAALVLVATIAPFGAYLAGLSRLPVSVASILAASEVVFGSAIGYVVFGEEMQALQIVGAALVIGGVVLIASRDRPVSPTLVGEV